MKTFFEMCGIVILRLTSGQNSEICRLQKKRMIIHACIRNFNESADTWSVLEFILFL